MKILITGADGFIAKNLRVRLDEENIDYLTFSKGDSMSLLEKKIKDTDIIFHFAGVNRPKSRSDFYDGNTKLTKKICDILIKLKSNSPIIFSSSIQVNKVNDYGISKLKAEEALIDLNKVNHNPITIYRLPNLFGKWCKPNYNSVVATFCYNIVNNLPITIDDPDAKLTLVYIDDLISDLINLLKTKEFLNNNFNRNIEISYALSIMELSIILNGFKNDRLDLVIDDVGSSLKRCLYSTYISYYNPSLFSYNLKENHDQRGVFAEFLKTKNSGQLSFFTANPGITRGGHYHNTKNEKFLVIHGHAEFKFKNIITEETHIICTSDKSLEVVETIPGWSHDITNIGKKELKVMLWANEVYDENKPDTIPFEVI
jgi:UDP-2-acetamido-2,6-beta-L-arabino-hexul-4-ose reductase